jgi:hypothetical protein
MLSGKQRKAYVASQRHEGWVCLPERYDDGGFSGGTVERPGLQRMLADIQDGRVDCVVVYKTPFGITIRRAVRLESGASGSLAGLSSRSSSRT